MTQVTQNSAPAALVIDATDNGVAPGYTRRLFDDDSIEVVRLNAIRYSNDWESLSRVRFVLGEWSGDATAPLRTKTKLASVHLLPMLIMVNGEPPQSAFESLRRHGVSAVFDGSAASQANNPALRELIHSTQWFTGRLDLVSVPDTVQILSTTGRSGLLVLACPHCRPLSAQSWCDTSARCFGNGSCPGAVARIYLVDGQPVHCETSESQGLAALGECLQWTKGVVRFCEVFLPPGEQTLEGTASQLLISAATMVDEASRLQPTSGRSARTASLDIPMNTNSKPPALPRRPNLNQKLQRLQRSYPNSSLIIQADREGAVKAATGTGDSSGVGAVAAIVSKAFEQATQRLALGAIEGWVLSGQDTSCITVVDSEDMVTAVVPSDDGMDGFTSCLKFDGAKGGRS